METHASSNDRRSGSDGELAELLAELAHRLQSGERVNADEYVRNHAEHAQQLKQMLPAMVTLAEMGLDQPSVFSSSPLNRDVASSVSGNVGNYRLLRELGRGGMGIVYDAEQISVGRRVALKILPFAALLNQDQLHRFTTEATAAARLQHPGIVQVYSVGCERGIHFYAMQLIEGPSLAKVISEIRNERHLGDKEEAVDTVVARQADVLTRDEDGGHYRAVARIGREAAEALHYAHENGVLHRDIKPSNLLLDKSGHVWIADFGLARVEDESQLTKTGDILGTLRYMSPEQATGDRLDARSDVYSLGATLYELVTLQPVYDAEDRRDIIKQVIAGNPVPPHKVDSRIPQPLSRVISNAMVQLDERYQSAQELAADLHRFLDGEPVSAKPPTLLRRSKAWARRHRLVSAAIVGLLILVLVLPFTTHYFFGGAADSPTKGDDMNVSKTAKVAATAAAMALITAGVNAKKPPKDPPPEPDPVPVEYQLTWIGDFGLGVTYAFGLNNVPVVVGRSWTADNDQRACRWSEATGIQDLNSLGAAWLDLETDEFVTGWKAITAHDINESNQIVGNARYTDQSVRAFVFHDSVGFFLLPTLGFGSHNAYNISETGVVLGRWKVDNDHYNQVAWLWNPEDPTQLSMVGPLAVPPSGLAGPKGINDTRFMLVEGKHGNSLQLFVQWIGRIGL
jgi:probable HAF family extracellular repeat protein